MLTLVFCLSCIYRRAEGPSSLYLNLPHIIKLVFASARCWTHNLRVRSMKRQPSFFSKFAVAYSLDDYICNGVGTLWQSYYIVCWELFLHHGLLVYTDILGIHHCQIQKYIICKLSQYFSTLKFQSLGTVPKSGKHIFWQYWP